LGVSDTLELPAFIEPTKKILAALAILALNPDRPTPLSGT
jgi:hypothetical protein